MQTIQTNLLLSCVYGTQEKYYKGATKREPRDKQMFEVKKR